MSAQVVIVGAGYAGVGAAKRLARSTRARVTVVNPRTDFVERIRLHQLLAGNRAATIPMSRMLPPSTELVQDSVVSIDSDQRAVELGGSGTVPFDYLIYAAGSRSRLDLVPGAGNHAVTVGGVEDALHARERLRGLPLGSSIAVVGAGLTGVEVAAELAERGEHAVHLVTDGLLAAGVSTKGRAYLRRHLTALGVDLIEDNAVTEVRQHQIVLADGQLLDSALTVMTAMIELPRLAADSGLDTDPDGALRVGPSLVSTSDTGIIGAGDASRIVGDPVRMSCQAAIPLGVHAAETVLHLLGGTRPRPVRPKFTGQCISLGRRAALWQQVSPSDEPIPLIITDRAGAAIKERICAATVGVGLNPRLSSLTYSWS